MRKFRESKFLTHVFFRLTAEHESSGWGFVAFSTALMSCLVCLLATLMSAVIVGTGDWSMGNTLFVAGGLLVGAGLPHLGLIHPANGLYGTSYEVGVEYYNLPEEDRLLFPPNIIGLLKDNSVDPDGKLSLCTEMRKTFKAIDERNKARLVRVDITDALEQIRQDRQYVESEIKTYKEFL